MSSERKPAVPTRNEQPVMGQMSKKNYLETNKGDAKHAAPKYVKKDNPDFLQKEDYGKVPSYLEKIKDDVEQMKKQKEDEEARKNAPKHRALTESEKEEMLATARANLQAVMKEYHQLPVSMHTLSQKQRKEELEKQIQSIERDINRLSRPVVYVEEN